MPRPVVLDTNVILSDPTSIQHYAENEEYILHIPIVVVKELDTFKGYMDKKGYNAREGSRLIEKYYFSTTGEPSRLVILHHEDNIIYENNDQRILNCLKQLTNNGAVSPIMVSNDLNVRILAGSAGCLAVRYDKDNHKRCASDLYDGTSTIIVEDYLVDRIYKKEDVILSTEEQLYPNQYIILQSEINPKRKAVARYVNKGMPLKAVNVDDASVWQLKPRNYEQYFAIDALLDPKIPLVSLIGIAGSGKTLLATGAGIQQVFGKNGSNKNYRKMLITRPIQPLGNDIGYLPGTEQEKLEPWIRPIMDNLDILMNGNREAVDRWIVNGDLEVEAITYIRGRSINNCYIIIDEAQNLTPHEVKTILTRVGSNTKIVLTGDIEQIDNSSLTQFNNGLIHAVEQFKEYDVAAHVTFTKGERSRIAELAAKIL